MSRKLLGAAVAAGLVLVAAIPMIGSSSADQARKRIASRGFEAGTQGWIAAGSGVTLSSTDAARSGERSAQMSTTQDTRMALRDRPDTVRNTTAGARYTTRVWVKAPRPGVTAVLRVREIARSRELRERKVVSVTRNRIWLADTGWHKLVVRSRPAGGHQLAISVIAADAKAGQSLLVDDLAVRARSAGKHRGTSAAAGRTLVGTSVMQRSGESWTTAVARQDRTLGRSSILRVFYPGLPQAWPGRAGQINRNVVVSFKANPKDVVSGRYDSRLRSWFAQAPHDRKIFWSYYHEPEDNIAAGQFTAAQYRAAWTHLKSLADKAHNPKLRSTLILMAYSLKKSSGRNWRSYYPGSSVIDVLGWDAYNVGAGSRKYLSPKDIYQLPARVSRAAGKPFGFAEWGSLRLAGDDGSRRAAWIGASSRYIAKTGAQFSTYFDSTVGGDYRLTDSRSQQAIRNAISGSG
jgi:hypothetical protein